MKTPKNNKLEYSIKNLSKALQGLEDSVTKPIQERRDLSGIVKDFEILYELSWVSLKRLLASLGHETHSAKDVFSTAFQVGIINNQDVWLEIIQDRNLTVHVYDETFAKEMCERIKTKYLHQFQELFSLIQKEAKR